MKNFLIFSAITVTVLLSGCRDYTEVCYRCSRIYSYNAEVVTTNQDYCYDPADSFFSVETGTRKNACENAGGHWVMQE